jgi:hypothetical protein
MKKKNFNELLKKLDGLNYCFFSGIVMFFLTKGKRKFNDVDILIDEGDIGKLATRLKADFRERVIEKAGQPFTNRSIEKKFKGFELEIITNSLRDEASRRTIKLILKNKIKFEFNNKKIFLEPIEELIARKALFYRDKDISDLKLIKKHKINLRLLNELTKGRKKNLIFSRLKKLNFQLENNE